MRHRTTFLVALSAILYCLSSMGALLKWVLFLSAWLATGGSKWCQLAYRTIGRDYRLLCKGARLHFNMAYSRIFKLNVVKLFRNVVKENPRKVALLNTINEQAWTYQEIEDYSNQIANYFLEAGYRKGDVVALLMENRPEYIATWIGLAKLGVIPALINFNLRSKSLLHTITVANSKAVIYGLELESAIQEIYPDLCQSTKELFYSRTGSSLPPSASSAMANTDGVVDLDSAVAKCSKEPEPASITDSISIIDPLLYIYTSGTTGLPKAVIIKHIRQLFASMGTYICTGQNPDDVIYCHLPLYHSAGGQIATAGTLFFGNTTVIRTKFSARNFWKDCVKYKVTATLYIGEICRYLLAQPETPEERQHQLRLMFGNGMKKQIWTKFCSRFNIPQIAEYYGSTEGNANVVNTENKPGCVGFLPVIFPDFLVERLLPLRLIQVDKETGEPLRGPDGFCILAETDQPGELVGKISKGHPLKDFEGYCDKKATSKKILTNVFRAGDSYFRSGDMLSTDEEGWMSFRDRAGDTFRWKGENVSTSEVENVVSDVLKLKDAVTSYGVEIPNTDGRAGMVAVQTDGDESTIDWQRLHDGLKAGLPAYARPMFVRLVKELQVTGTYKVKKNVLQSEGFDRIKINEPLYFLNAQAGRYEALTPSLYADIMSGKVRV